jgi:S-adenosylmethionine-diacylglycerol 3-amino-3-carboxypropyl transferase
VSAPAQARGWFGLIYRHNLIYNQCWEDPAVDGQALDLGPRDRVMVITSAGCNTLDYALSGATVLAVDANPRQNHLLELKLAGIRALDYEAFFELFGSGGTRRAEEIYAALRPQLRDDDARRYWDEAIRLFDPRRSRGRSFYYCGTSGLFALAFRRYLDGAGLTRPVERILAAGSVAEQVALYRAELRERLLGNTFLFRAIGSEGVLALLGVPRPQRSLVAGHPGGVVGFLRDCLDRVMSVCLLRENYFWSVYLRGGYTPESCPRYLSRDGFARLQSGLADRVSTRTATVTAALRSHDTEPISAFVLLDHLDWLIPHPELIEEEWRAIFASAAPGARVIFRSGGADAAFLPAAVRERLDFDAHRARQLHARDRVATYGSFHIARLAPA